MAIKSLTETELELMNILWRLGEGNVKTVLNHLPEDRNLAYTSVSTILRILVKKEFLSIRQEGRNHIYVPSVPQEDYKDSALSSMVENVFDGKTSDLLIALAEKVHLSHEDRSELLSILEKSGGKL